MCSTPFGVTDFDTVASCSCRDFLKRNPKAVVGADKRGVNPCNNAEACGQGLQLRGRAQLCGEDTTAPAPRVPLPPNVSWWQLLQLTPDQLRALLPAQPAPSCTRETTSGESNRTPTLLSAQPTPSLRKSRDG